MTVIFVKSSRLLSASGVVSIGSGDQGGDEGAEQGLSASAGVVDELEEAEIGWQLLLGDAAVRPQPGAQQRPEALQRVDVDLAEAVAVLVPRVLAAAVADGLVPVTPGFQPSVDAVLVGVHEGASSDGGLDDGPDRNLPDVGQHSHGHLATAPEQAEDRRLLLRQRAATGGGPQPPAAA